jgi:hypothetical protein
MAKPNFSPRSRIRRHFEDLGAVLSIGALIAAAVLCLRLQDPEPQGPGAEPESAVRPGESTVVFHEVLHIWLSESFVDLAKRDSGCGTVRSHQELRAVLERHACQGLFYAYKVRVYQANGDHGEVAAVRYPYDEPWNYPEFSGFVAIAAGTLPRADAVDYSRAAVHVMPARTSRQELLDAIEAPGYEAQAAPRDRP